MKLSVLLIACLIFSLAGYAYLENAGSKSIVSAEATQELALTRPALSADDPAASTFLSQEAGLAIWCNATFAAPINLNAAKNAMVNIENYTSTYVIGSLSDNGSIALSDDYPHCFVDINGWFVVYYLKVNTLNPGTTGWIGKIIDWSQYSNNKLSGNFLSEGLNYIVTKTIGEAPTNEQYFHFQFPNATKLLIAIKHAGDNSNDTFNIEIPSNITVYEESWSCYSTMAAGTLTFDNTVMCSTPGSGSYGSPPMSTSLRAYGGTETSYQMLSEGVFHTIRIIAAYGPNFVGYHSSNDAYGCLLLLYS